MYPAFHQLNRDIDAFYTSTRPCQFHVEEKEKLITYITNSVEYLQQTLREEIQAKEYSRENERGTFLDNMATKSRGTKRVWSVFKFGSESWGTSCGDSDVDMGIGLNFPNSRFDKKFVLKQLAQSISEGDKDGQLRIQTLLHAKYPIIRIQHLREDAIKMDISIADRYCRRRNDFIRNVIAHYETRYELPVRKLIIFIKKWAKIRGINNSYYGYLNSYGFTLLILKFVQSLVAQHALRYTRSVADLVVQFFDFYTLRYDLSAYSVSLQNPFVKDAVPKAGRIHERRRNLGPYPTMMQVVDPVNDQNNVASAVGHTQYHRMGTEFIRAFNILKESAVSGWTSSQSVFQQLTQPLHERGHVMRAVAAPQMNMAPPPATTIEGVVDGEECLSSDGLDGATTTSSDSELKDEGAAIDGSDEDGQEEVFSMDYDESSSVTADTSGHHDHEAMATASDSESKQEPVTVEESTSSDDDYAESGSVTEDRADTAGHDEEEIGGGTEGVVGGGMGAAAGTVLEGVALWSDGLVSGAVGPGDQD